MGIPGIYKEIGPGTRISLAKLATEHLEKTNQRFRLAIDVAIWQFQTQSGQGGQNPALRTLYYRLLKLLGLGIRPLFVFDGPYKPKVKRNVRHTPFSASLDNFLVKELLNRFGFPYHDAPGEAEAECALLQKEGVVDAVLSEDVDTMMFGSKMSLRSWTCEGGRSAKTPTHVTMHTAESTEESAGLDHQGMVLVALMSGGDYDTEGLAHCGPKIACEAARAKFGRDLYQLSKEDREGLKAWRERLQHELRTNKSRFFKQKHKTINVPETFPDQTVLDFYKRPTVSSPDKVMRLKASIKWATEIDIPALRAFVAEAFNWTYLVGAKHFIRGLAPVLLAHKLLTASMIDDVVDDDLEAKAAAEARYVVAIHGRRFHGNTDGCPELRVSFVPANIVRLDLSGEEDIDRAEDALGDLEANEIESDREERPRSASPIKRNDKSVYDPDLTEKIWMLEASVKVGVPLLVEQWEEDMRKPSKFASRKAREKSAVSKAAKNAPCGTMDQYVKVTKRSYKTKEHATFASQEYSSAINSTKLPAADIATVLREETSAALHENLNSCKRTRAKKPASSQETAKSSRKIENQPTKTPLTPPNTKGANPWTLAKRPSDTYNFKTTTRYSALGIYAPNDPENHERRSARPDDPIQQRKSDRSQDLLLLSAAETPHRKHSREVSSDANHSSNASPSKDLGIQSGNNVTLRRLRQRASTKPLPKKRQSPSEIRNHTLSALQSETASLPREQVNCSDTTKTLVPTLAPIEDVDYVSIASDHSSLPSPSAMFYSRRRYPAGSSPVVSAFPHHEGSASVFQHERYTSRKAVMIRESLEGAWKLCEPDKEHTGKHVLTSVEVLDMTANDGP